MAKSIIKSAWNYRTFDHSTLSVIFNETCINEGLLPKYTIYIVSLNIIIVNEKIILFYLLSGAENNHLTSVL